MIVSEAWAQTIGGGAVGGMESLQQFLPLILIFLVFYFLMIRPQQKKVKAHREMVNQLRRGDRVLTQGGIIGQIYKVLSDTEVSVEIADGVRVKVMRTAIAEVLAKTEPVGGGKDGKEEAETTPAPGEASAGREAQQSGFLGQLFGKK
jgi:preprotein translocase subunit YajC